MFMFEEQIFGKQFTTKFNKNIYINVTCIIIHDTVKHFIVVNKNH